MDPDYLGLLEKLRSLGWQVELLDRPQGLPEEVSGRYPWIPADYAQVIARAKTIVSPDETAWLLTAHDFSGTGARAYAWNEWERQSLEAAGDDSAWQDEIRTFWNRHFPVLTSVKSGYAYLAIDSATARVVSGEEPEYEETEVVAGSMKELLGLITGADPRLRRWI